MSEDKVYSTLPIKLPYKDKIELTRHMLQAFSTNVTHLTSRDMDVLTIALIEGLDNKEKIYNYLLKSVKGINDKSQIYTQFSKLRNKGLIDTNEEFERDKFNPFLEKIRQVINSKNNNKAIMYKYEKV